jgi:hypothetical protein
VSRRDPGRAGYQGERLHLRVNHLAASELSELLGSAATDPTLSPMLRQTSLVLPDGRRLEVSVQVTDDGVVYDGHGEYVGEDGQPHVDISGDFAVHVAASRVMAAATSGYRQPWSLDAAAAVDVNRVRQALDEHLVTRCIRRCGIASPTARWLPQTPPARNGSPRRNAETVATLLAATGV